MSGRLGDDAAGGRSRLTLQSVYLLIQLLRSLLPIAVHLGARAKTQNRRDLILAEKFRSMGAHDHIPVVTDVSSGIAIVHFIGDAGRRYRSAVLYRGLQQRRAERKHLPSIRAGALGEKYQARAGG